ncbi:hypothetical protein BDN72DRAFT_905979 [Pluteus cervinus]|uniref:Uncharacterized protein n=1 Tax=Pluteus cervinus TaxID=181527 RepID=A0ACD3A0C8_9AGAR|nr:hypothetical protein BDN72DRAFT_905979 [Pluteus cervinus]
MDSDPPALIPNELVLFYNNLKKTEASIIGARNKINYANRTLRRIDDELVSLSGFIRTTRKRVALGIDIYRSANVDSLITSSVAGAFAADVAKLIACYDVMNSLPFSEECLDARDGPSDLAITESLFGPVERDAGMPILSVLFSVYAIPQTDCLP